LSQTVERALTILKFLTDDRRSLAEVADLLGVHKSTALRLLQTLEAGGFVRHNEEHRYWLGPQIFRLAAFALGNLDIRAVAATPLRRLAERTQQTVHLAAFDGTEVFYIDKYEAQTSVRMYSRIGASAPFYCTGVAKAILSALPEKERRSIAEGLNYVRHTERTPCGPEELLRDLARSVERGYALDDGEHEDYIHCIAVPLCLVDGRPTHGISVSATTMSMSPNELVAFVPLLQETAAAIRAEVS